MENKIKVELVGGPLCGFVADWSEGMSSLTFEKHAARYEFEGITNSCSGTPRNTAIYKGWSEGL